MTEEIEEAQEKIEQMPGIIEQLNRLEQQALKSTLDRKKQLDKEKSLLDRAGQAVEDLAHALEVFAQEQEYAISPDLMNESSRMNLLHPEFLVNQRRLLDKVEATFRQHMRDLPAQLRNLWNEGADERTNWKQQYDQEEEAYQQLLREHPDASIDTYINLQRKRQNLELIQQDVNKRKQRIAELRQERHQLLQNLQELYQQEFDIRQQKIEKLNRLLDGAVTIRIEREGNRDAYESYLREKLRGTNKRGIDRITSTVRVNGDYASPIDFVAAIRKEQELAPGQTSDLETVYHENENGRRILANLPETILFDIETFRIPDLPIIELQVNNRSKPLNELSVGQKCTAILSLILVERGSPLVIDQPEDDLDNRFIFEEIVQTLRREKERRQFIIATHNANIPVSGDAELIVVLDADEEHGWVECSGSIDEESIREPVENILEGGREAFRMRQAKYGAETWTD
jgi:hypothetical protein